MEDNTATTKIYYTIGEVSRLTHLKPYVLRYWETEFPTLRPKKSAGGTRLYRTKDINQIFLIKRLLYDEGYTIEGAKKKLLEYRRNPALQLELPIEETRTKQIIENTKTQLREIIKIVETIRDND